MRKPKSLRELLLTHELTFVVLIILAVAGGSYGIFLWDKSAKESQRIHSLVQEIQQTRGNLYRQMKELFDAFFLEDMEARDEYKAYTQSILSNFSRLHALAQGEEEKQAIADLEHKYRAFAEDAPDLFYRYQAAPSDISRRSLYKDMETGIFARYETVSQRAEDLLKLKQDELKTRLDDAKQTSILLLSIPILLAGLLLILSRRFLKREIVNPINAITHATAEISAGNLTHKAPKAGAVELAILSQEINKMAEDLAESRDALVRSEKQAAMGLLVPMLAHNIRNPLASIRATAQVIDIPTDDKDNQESLKGIINSVDRLERWTGSLLAYLHPIKPRLTKVKLQSVIDGALTPLAGKISERNLRLVQSNPPNREILTDEHLLEQALYNVILNAIEASPANGTIEIKTSLSRDMLEISISDEGPGMPFTPDPHAVSPGPSTKRFGTGLGIPFAFKVCEVLSGNISFNPANPKGTQIRLQLPQ
jgi:signal transduction histidine kinase